VQRSLSASSKRWLSRQAKDSYVKKAKAARYRARSAYKLLEINNKFKLIQPGYKIIDLGCAPGGWLQVCRELMPYGSGMIVGLDVNTTDSLEGVKIIQGDFMEEQVCVQLLDMINGECDLLLSDMRGSAIGHRKTDHIRSILLCEAVCDFGCKYLKKGGSMVMKVVQGGEEKNIVNTLRPVFDAVRYFKPNASRSDSAEIYVVAICFRGV